MRTLLLLRGAPGCGKSTWIKDHGLADYALSADKIRLMYAGPQLTPDGGIMIDQKNDKQVWKTLFAILEDRMANGEFTVIDATNSKTSDINRYKKLCDDYKYRMYCVDMTDIPIVLCKARNLRRDPLLRVPDDVIEKIYARFATQKIPSGITVIKPDELDKVWFHKIDLSKWKAIHHIGDIHGCYTALMEYLNGQGGIKDDEFYIFLGDYLDRGAEDVETLNLMLELVERPNVFLLEGNHERHIWDYASGGTTRSREFEIHTRQELDDAGFDKRELRKFYRRIGQCAWYDYHGREFLVTHGGLSSLPQNLTLVSTKQLIKGVGSYQDHGACAQSFDRFTCDNVFQIHAHRNTRMSPIRESERSYNLEGRVEMGGELRVLKITPDGDEEFNIKNTVVRKDKLINYHPDTEEEHNQASVADTVIRLRENKHIMEKRFGDISSFNFTRDAFYKGIWNEQTVKARGLYIDIPHQRVVARAYNKFFNVGEVEETKLDVLQRGMSFPATAYRKENGFLGLVSYDPYTEDLFITTKSNPEGEYAAWLRAMVLDRDPIRLEFLKQYLKEHNVTAVFECVDMEHDPHVIDYPKSHLFLLDLVKNDIKYSKMDYDEVRGLAGLIGTDVKKECLRFASWQEFYDWYQTVTEENYPDKIEGYVVEDANGYMVKVKLPYYRFWKRLRGLAQAAIKRGELNPSQAAALYTPLSNHFFDWAKSLHERPDREELPMDIVTLRRMFAETEVGRAYAAAGEL